MGYKTKSMLHNRSLANVESKTYYGQQGAKERLTGEVSGPAQRQISSAPTTTKSSGSTTTSKWAEIGTLAGMLINSAKKPSGSSGGSTSNSIGRSTDKFDEKILTAEAKGRVKKAGRLEAMEANWDRKQNQGGNTTLNKISSEGDQNHYGGTEGKSKSTFSERRKAKLENNRKELADNQKRRDELGTSAKKASEEQNVNPPTDIKAFEKEAFKKKVVSNEVLNDRIEFKQQAEAIRRMNKKSLNLLPYSSNTSGFSKTLTPPPPTKENPKRASRRYIKNKAKEKSEAKAYAKRRSDFRDDSGGTVPMGVSMDQQISNNMYRFKGMQQGFTSNELKNSKTYLDKETGEYRTEMSNMNPNFPYNKKKKK